jgi:hypothetical protein
MQRPSDPPASLRRATRPRAGALLTGALASAFSLAACVGHLGDPTPGDPQTATPGQLVAARFPRLSHAQWELTIVDLFHLDAPTGLSAAFTPDPLAGKAFDNNQAVLDVSPSLWSDYQRAAETIAARVTGDTAQLARFLPANLPGDPAARSRAFLVAFGQRVYRMPLRPEELQARQALFDQGAALYPDLDPFVAGVRLSVTAFLQSPRFLYRAELGEQPSTVGAPLVALGGWEMASRLSYAIWNSMPDEELFRAAAAGELAQTAGIHEQIVRMIQSSRARAVVTRFFDQLYGGAQYETISKSKASYPQFVPKIGAEMRSELRKFTASIYQAGGGVRELLTSTTTFVTPRLAAVYGLSHVPLREPDSDGFSRVELDPGQRSGLLTRAGFLAWKGTDSQPNTIQRGVFITRRIICQKLGAPPAAAQGATVGGQKTDRERIEALTGQGTCGAGCHGTYINAPGFALEHYGAMGEYRTQDGDTPIDAAANFPFDEGPVAFADAVDFSQVLARSPQVHACFSGFLVEYLLGREAAPTDDILVASLAKLSLSGASARDLLVSVLESDVVRYPLTIEELQ